MLQRKRCVPFRRAASGGGGIRCAPGELGRGHALYAGDRLARRGLRPSIVFDEVRRFWYSERPEQNPPRSGNASRFGGKNLTRLQYVLSFKDSSEAARGVS